MELPVKLITGADAAAGELAQFSAVQFPPTVITTGELDLSLRQLGTFSHPEMPQESVQIPLGVLSVYAVGKVGSVGAFEPEMSRIGRLCAKLTCCLTVAVPTHRCMLPPRTAPDGQPHEHGGQPERL